MTASSVAASTGRWIKGGCRAADQYPSDFAQLPHDDLHVERVRAEGKRHQIAVEDIQPLDCGNPVGEALPGARALARQGGGSPSVRGI